MMEKHFEYFNGNGNNSGNMVHAAAQGPAENGCGNNLTNGRGGGNDDNNNIFGVKLKSRKLSAVSFTSGDDYNANYEDDDNNYDHETFSKTIGRNNNDVGDDDKITSRYKDRHPSPSPSASSSSSSGNRSSSSSSHTSPKRPQHIRAGLSDKERRDRDRARASTRDRKFSRNHKNYNHHRRSLVRTPSTHLAGGDGSLRATTATAATTRAPAEKGSSTASASTSLSPLPPGTLLQSPFLEDGNPLETDQLDSGNLNAPKYGSGGANASSFGPDPAAFSVTDVLNQNLRFSSRPLQKASPPSFFSAPSPKRAEISNWTAGGTTPSSLTDDISAAFNSLSEGYQRPGFFLPSSSSSSSPKHNSLVYHSGRDIGNATPDGFHRHSLIHTPPPNNNHQDHHLHKRRKKQESDLPAVYSLSPGPTSTPRANTHRSTPSATSTADLLSTTSLDHRGDVQPSLPQHIKALSSQRPNKYLKPRAFSTPALRVDDLFSPLRSLNTSSDSANYFGDGLHELYYRQPAQGCQVYDMVVQPSTATFSVSMSNGTTSTSEAGTTTPPSLRSLAVPIRDSPPEGLPRVNLLEVLASDARPTFILGTVSSTTGHGSRQSSTAIHDLQLEVVYHNDAFSSLLPDAAFSTTDIEPGYHKTTFNITDPNYHRWISSSFANTSIQGTTCRPYVCPDGILWTQNAFTDTNGARMVMICGVPLPSSIGPIVQIKKGELSGPHQWETAMEIAKGEDRDSLNEEEGTTFVADNGEDMKAESIKTPAEDLDMPSVGPKFKLNDKCDMPGCISVEEVMNKDESKVGTSVIEPLQDHRFYNEIAKELDSEMVISPIATPAPESSVTPAANTPVLRAEEMDITDDDVETQSMTRDSRISTVYSPHLPSDYGFFDWTRLPPSIASDAHTELVRQVNWAKTGFGAIETWPQSLRTMINLVLCSPHPAALYWGPEFSIVYNEPYIPLIGAKHPQLLGEKYSVGWSEIWSAIEPVFADAVQTGKPTNKEDDRLFMLRNGFREETYFSWSICPIMGEDGTVVGLHNPAFEKTRRVIAERRMLTLREVGERCGSAREVKSFWKHILAALETNPWDAPFAILYSCKKNDSTDSEVSSSYASSFSNTRMYSLEGTIGVPAGHPAAPATMDLKSNAEGFSIAFKEALQIEGNIFLSEDAGTLPADLMEGIDVQGFSEDMCSAAVVCPINPNSETPLGFLVLGINPRRPFDDDYRLFIQLLTRQLTTSVASVVLYEEEIRRGQRALRLAALDKVELSHQLAIKSKEAEHSDLKFTRLAEFAPVGIFLADFQGKINYYNDMFTEISGHPVDVDISRWLESVHPADTARTEANWLEVVNGKKRKTWEFRWRQPWSLPNHMDEQVDRWTLLSASPELDTDGMLLGVFGSITNISETKFAEDLQKRRVEEVVELKRQQDNFVDMASHEMRNPLSAILQGADAVLASLERYRELASARDLLDDIESSIDVAQTISLCALHQKRVVDDILTMSKLDAALLAVTPVDVQPIVVVDKAFKMFEQEAVSSETKMTFKVDDSYAALGIDWVKLDPARLLQVLINLLTNALKFLRTEASKSIIVTMGASMKRPSSDAKNSIVFFPSTRKPVDLTKGADWGNGDPIFLTFSVLDTGKGLTETEKKNLFQKFSQATAKTEVSYGGSGLGLFICKELVHLQSGEIGVQSEAGKGCVFSFYIKSRKSGRPEVEVPQLPVLRSTGSAKRRDAGPSSPAVASPVTDSGGFQSPRAPPGKSPKSKTEQQKLDYKVLIVEDNLVNQKLLRRALEVTGCTTFVANHGMEALDRIKDTVYWKDAKEGAQQLSVILMDVEMPVMDGLTCSRKIRELQAEGSILKHIPIIAVTANARQAQIDKMFDAGMDDVVSKPYRITELIPKLHSVVAKYNTPELAAAVSPDME